MPWKPRAGCRHMGCGARESGGTGYCEKHQAVAHFRERARLNELKERKLERDPVARQHYEFYKSRRWRQLRRLHLNEEPLCRECGRGGTVVDHIIQLSRGGDPYAEDNLQTMCDACHNRKRAREAAETLNRTKTQKRTKINI